MQHLTFGGFLKQYVRELSAQESMRLYPLAREAERSNHRLREPLALYAVFNDKAEVLARAAKGDWLPRELLQMSPEDLLGQLEREESALPEAAVKVYRSYLVAASRQAADDHSKGLMHRRIRSLQAEKGISNYRLYHQLGLNPGNVNAYLKHGDVSKVSLQTARMILDLAKRI